MANEIRVPTLGESVTEATIGQWFKKPGDPVKADEPLVELETDKVTVEVPAPASGVMGEIVAREGDTVEVGALLGTVSEGSGDASSSKSSRSSGNGGAKADAKPAKSSSAATAKSGKVVDVVVPSAGESVTEAGVGSWFKKAGDFVRQDEALVELETDKAAQEVPSPVTGTIVEILAGEGDTVQVGAVLARIEEGDEASAKALSKGIERAEDELSPPAERPGVPASPSAAKLLAENKMSPDQVDGSGKRGQVLKGDVLEALEKGTAEKTDAVAAAPKAARAPSSGDDEAREERVKMTRLRQTIARRLKDAQDTAAMLTTFNEVDMTAVMDLRKRYKDLFEKKHGVKLGFMGFFTKAITHALKEIPAVNAEIDGNDIIYKNYCHIGVAVGTDKGLVVPVVRDADQMTIAEIEKDISRLGLLARDGQLSLSDMQGGTFTISNGGVYGSLMSTPILNAPQSGILGMHKIQDRPMAVDGQIVIRPMMYLALSYDHRIVDGKEAVTFLVRVKDSLEDPERLVLDL
jgi:2-oxoglutarate dehydrogenase E2 component (dihydrolipoamide succinyltransferase)